MAHRGELRASRQREGSHKRLGAGPLSWPGRKWNWLQERAWPGSGINTIHARVGRQWGEDGAAMEGEGGEQARWDQSKRHRGALRPCPSDSGDGNLSGKEGGLDNN